MRNKKDIISIRYSGFYAYANASKYTSFWISYMKTNIMVKGKNVWKISVSFQISQSSSQHSFASFHQWTIHHKTRIKYFFSINFDTIWIWRDSFLGSQHLLITLPIWSAIFRIQTKAEAAVTRFVSFTNIKAWNS